MVNSLIILGCIKKFSKLVTNLKVDNIYDKSLDLGSYGGKLLGAGNGGFVFFLAGKRI